MLRTSLRKWKRYLYGHPYCSCWFFFLHKNVMIILRWTAKFSYIQFPNKEKYSKSIELTFISVNKTKGDPETRVVSNAHATSSSGYSGKITTLGIRSGCLQLSKLRTSLSIFMIKSTEHICYSIIVLANCCNATPHTVLESTCGDRMPFLTFWLLFNN